MYAVWGGVDHLRRREEARGGERGRGVYGVHGACRRGEDQLLGAQSCKGVDKRQGGS